MNDRTYPVVEEYDELFNELVKNHFNYVEVPENRLIPMGIGDMVSAKEIVELRNEIILFASNYGFPNTKPNGTSLTAFDKKLGKKLYNKMNITPSIAATIPMWHFINLSLFPDLVYWRFGGSKSHFVSERRNYFGTQWWRYYIFSVLGQGEDVYMSMTDRNVADLYERTNSCGYPQHVTEQYIWFSNLYNKLSDNEMNNLNRDNLFRTCLKLYSAKISFRLFFSLTAKVKEELFTQCFSEALEIVKKEESSRKKYKIKVKQKGNITK